MKLQRSTVILVAVALLLGGVVLLTQTDRSGPNDSTSAQSDTDASPIFEFEEADVVGLQIETDGQEVVFEQDESGFWQMIQPEEHPAEEAAIAFLLSRLTTDGLVQTTTIDAANPSEFGLEVPFATVELTLADDSTHLLVLGDADFSGQNYYALVDPEEFPLLEDAGEVSAAIVSANILSGVDRPLEEWRAIVETPEPEEPEASTEESAPDSETLDEESATDDDESQADGEAAESEDALTEGEMPNEEADEEANEGRDESSTEPSEGQSDAEIGEGASEAIPEVDSEVTESETE